MFFAEAGRRWSFLFLSFYCVLKDQKAFHELISWLLIVSIGLQDCHGLNCDCTDDENRFYDGRPLKTVLYHACKLFFATITKNYIY